MKKKIGILIFVFMLSFTSIWASPPSFTEESNVVYGLDTLHMYKHDRTGLKLVWVENDDKRTCFTLGVKTPTTDSTGVNHIIEHTVFTGSEKYPSASLFFDANAVYPHIYMNASTSSDLTMYPFCTPYTESFEGLLNVYLDSVLNPDMLNGPSNFYEEAFYYDPDTKQFGGVVYNEMKGANGNAGRILFRNIRKSIYQGTHYANDSGGVAEEIPKLTYEEFVDTYKRHYYPGNMMIVLYGDVPIKKTLTTIDKYLEKYTESKEPIELNVEPTDIPKEITETYEGGEGSFVVKSFLIKENLISEQMAELDLWVNTYLLDTNSYFINELRKQGVSNVEVCKDGELKYPVYSIVVSGVPESQTKKIDAILDAVIESMKSMSQNEDNVAKDMIERTKLSFYQADHAATRGINIAQNIIGSWAHEREIDQYYKVKNHIAAIEEISDSCQEIFLGTDYISDMILVPGEAEEMTNPLEISPVSQDQWEQVVKDMRAWQAGHKESGLQEVNLKDLVMDNSLKYQSKKTGDITYTAYQTESDLINTELYFPTEHIEQDDLPYLFLYPIFLNEAAKELSPFQGIVAGNATAIDNKSGYTPYIKFGIVTSKNNKEQDKLFNQARQALLTKSEEWYGYQIDQFIAQFSAEFQSDIIGTLTALNMAGQEGSKRYIYEEYYPLYQFCVNIKKTGNTDFINQIKKIDSKIGPMSNSYIGVATDKQTCDEMLEIWRNYCKANRIENGDNQQYNFSKSKKNNIYYRKTNVDYLVYSYDKGREHVKGLDYLAASYITKNYLQPNIRVKKGAYGSSMNISFPNNISIYTYRDPEYQTSIDMITNMAPILKADLTKEKVQVAKSGAICELQNQFGLLNNDMRKASVLQLLMIMGIDKDYVVGMQKDIIKSDLVDVNKYLDTVAEMIKSSQLGICTDKATIPTQSEVRMYNLR